MLCLSCTTSPATAGRWHPAEELTPRYAGARAAAPRRCRAVRRLRRLATGQAATTTRRSPTGRAARGVAPWTCRPTAPGRRCRPPGGALVRRRLTPGSPRPSTGLARGRAAHPVHGAARRLPGAARPAHRPGRHQRRHRRSPAATARSSSDARRAASSTPSCCAPTCPATRRSASCSPAPGTTALARLRPPGRPVRTPRRGRSTAPRPEPHPAVPDDVRSCNPGRRGPRRLPGGRPRELFDDGFAQAKFDLMLDAWREPDGLQLSLNYRTDLFDAATADRLIAALRRCSWRRVAADPDRRLSAWTCRLPRRTGRAADRSGRGPVRAGPRRRAELIAARAADPGGGRRGRRRRPADLRASSTRRADRLARRLRGLGVGPGPWPSRVCPRPAHRTRRHAARRCCGPAAPTCRSTRLPGRARRGHARRQRRRPSLVADALGTLPEPAADALRRRRRPRRHRGRRTLAYVIYTSGLDRHAQGRRRVPRRGLPPGRAGCGSAYDLGADDRVVQFASLELRHARRGGLAGADRRRRGWSLLPPGEDLPELLARGPGVTVLDLPTPYWHELRRPRRRGRAGRRRCGW